MKNIIFDNEGNLLSKRLYPRKREKTKEQIFLERVNKKSKKCVIKYIVPDYIKRLRKYRLQMGLSQQELAGKLKTKQSAISRFENGKGDVTISFIKRYCRLFGLEVIIRIRTRKVRK